MSAQDRDYYLSRAEAELELAQCATHPAAMRAHYHLAGFYLDKVYGAQGDGQARTKFPVLRPMEIAAPPVQAA